MLKTVVLFSIFVETDTYFQDSLIIRTFKTTVFIYFIKYNIYNIIMSLLIDL